MIAVPAAVSIEDFSHADADAIFSLIMRIQEEEHGGTDSEAETADLRSIATTYSKGASGFWVAKHDGHVIGTAALADLGDGSAMLKRMYVSRNFRGSATGTASALLRRVVARAECHGIAHIVLGTMSEPVAAPRFYEKHGFVPIARDEMPAGAPISEMDDRFYRRDL